jgi:hypothetical protein
MLLVMMSLQFVSPTGHHSLTRTNGAVGFVTSREIFDLASDHGAAAPEQRDKHGAELIPD